MKGKFSSKWRVAIALVLVAGLSLVTAVPAVADTPADTDVGFQLGKASADAAAWSTDNTAPSGSYSVKLTHSASASEHAWVQFIPPAGISLTEFVAAPATYGFTYWRTEDKVGPLLEMRFTDGGDALAEITLDMALYDYLDTATYPKETWIDKLASATEQCMYYGEDSADVGLSGTGTLGDLSDLITDIADGAAADDAAAVGAWEMTRVRVDLGWSADTQDSAWVDDVIIDGVTYELEPIFLDAEYYSVGATVVVTVPNFNVNTDSIRAEPVGTAGADHQVTVISDSDSGGITVDLEETGADTGVFTGSFTTVGTLPAGEDELYVQDGDAIKVGYDANWGDGSQTLTPYTLAEVDDTAPAITVVSPADGATTEDATPMIKASYSDATADIDQTSVEMLVNGVDVTDDATVTGSDVTYTPTDDLVEGSHDVVVNVSDNAGNAATESWSFRVVSWLVEPESVTDSDSLDALDTVGVAVSGAGSTADITVGRYASNPEPDAPPTFTMIEDGFFDVQVLNAENATQIVIKFADDNITADSVAYFWDDIEGAWLECSDQGYNSVGEYLWVKVRTDTTPNIAELEGTPFAISGGVALDSIAASPESVTLDDVDETQQLTVTATYSDASTVDVTAEASYESSDTSVATVSTGGLITAVAEGDATVTVTYDTKTTTVSVTVGFDPMVYDADGDGVISKTEALTAVADYFDGVITKEQALLVIVEYMG